MRMHMHMCMCMCICMCMCMHPRLQPRPRHACTRAFFCRGGLRQPPCGISLVGLALALCE